MKEIEGQSAVIFTDGSSRGNPGPGGWGSVVIIGNDRVIEIGDREDRTTNNRMEIMAAIQGLKQSPEGSAAIIYTDSSYVINGITKWIKGWKRNDWQTKAKEDVLNKDLWMDLDQEASKRKVAWKYVGGHIGIAGNERCDVIATSFADGSKVDLYRGPLSGYMIRDIMSISHDLDKAVTKKSSSSHSKAKAYSYVSRVDGKIETHKTWAECERRVKGVKGAKFKKALSVGDEAKIKSEYLG